MTGKYHYETENGFTYEVDYDRREARRLHNGSGHRTHFDERTRFTEAYCPGVGHSLFVHWHEGQESDGQYWSRNTQTSRVVRVQKVVEA